MVDKDGWRLSAQPTEKLGQEDKAVWLTSKILAKHARRSRLPDLLIEVDNQLRTISFAFTRNFLTPAQRQEPSPEDIRAVCWPRSWR